MERIKRTTVNLPAELLADATKLTGKGITETIVTGLELVRRRSAYDKAKQLRGRLRLDIDINSSRERSRR